MLYILGSSVVVKVSDYSYSFGLLVLGCAAIPIPSLDLELVLIVHIFPMVPNFPPCFNLVGWNCSISPTSTILLGDLIAIFECTLGESTSQPESNNLIA